MVDRPRRGARRSSNSFHTCSALGFLVGMVESRRELVLGVDSERRKDPYAATACGAPAVKPDPSVGARDTRARLRSGELASPSVLAFALFIAAVDRGRRHHEMT